MIATLSGIVAEKLDEVVVLDVRGVGFGVLISVEDFSHLQVHDAVKLYIHEHIRENAHDLYGFTNLDSKSLFEQLLNVTGVGPKMALNILSIGATQNVRAAIASGDTKYMQAASGVGKRVAERVIVDLKDKVGLLAAEDATQFLQAPSLVGDEAAQALVSLGYSPQDAAAALLGVDKSLTTQDRIKQALKGGTR
ncbi:MAG: Holliday junction branch migration protein RuvA [Candidatus Saccharimonadales bacterium]